MLSVYFVFHVNERTVHYFRLHPIARSFVLYMQIHSLLHPHDLQAMQAIGRWQTEQHDSETV
jgi:hypothetical protein